MDKSVDLDALERRSRTRPGLMDVTVAEYQTLIAELRASRKAESWLRELLWLHHGHDALYGDDGERQCRGVDFKRDSLETIDRHVVDATRASRTPKHRGKCPVCGFRWGLTKLGVMRQHWVWSGMEGRVCRGSGCEPAELEATK